MTVAIERTVAGAADLRRLVQAGLRGARPGPRHPRRPATVLADLLQPPRRDGSLSLANFAALANDPSLRKPISSRSPWRWPQASWACLIATPLAWLVAVRTFPDGGAVRAFVTASFVTPPFLGAIAWEILAAPTAAFSTRSNAGPSGWSNTSISSTSTRSRASYFAIACYTFPYVFTLVANALDRVPRGPGGGIGHARRGRRHDPAAHHAAARPAGNARRALVAVLQALTMFGTPAILALPAGFHVITTKIWEPVPVSAQAGPGGRLRAAAAPDHGAAGVGAGADHRTARLHHRGREERRCPDHASRPRPLDRGRLRVRRARVTVIMPYLALMRRR